MLRDIFSKTVLYVVIVPNQYVDDFRNAMTETGYTEFDVRQMSDSRVYSIMQKESQQRRMMSTLKNRDLIFVAHAATLFLYELQGL